MCMTCQVFVMRDHCNCRGLSPGQECFEGPRRLLMVVFSLRQASVPSQHPVSTLDQLTRRQGCIHIRSTRNGTPAPCCAGLTDSCSTFCIRQFCFEHEHMQQIMPHIQLCTWTVFLFKDAMQLTRRSMCTADSTPPCVATMPCTTIIVNMTSMATLQLPCWRSSVHASVCVPPPGLKSYRPRYAV